MSVESTLEQLKNFDLNDIDFGRAGVWPLPGKIFVCVLLAALILFLSYYLKVSDLQDELAIVTAKEAGLRETFKTKSYEAANLEAYKAQMAEMNVTFEKLLSRLPQKTEIAGLLEDIGAKGRESGLTINSLGIRPEVVAEYYIEVPIGIQVRGGYHDLGGFVSGVAALPRIVTLHDFSIVRSGRSQGLEMEILAKTYRYKAPDGNKEQGK